MSAKLPRSRRQATPRRAWMLFLAASLLLLGLAGLSAGVLAQASASHWAEPVNLSRSGTASDPAIVVLPDGTLRVLWWDQFEGLMISSGRAPLLLPAGESEASSTAWSDPAPAPILLSRATEQSGQQVAVRTPVEVMPHLLGDATGRAHALWLGEVDVESGEQPLHYSRLAPDQISWSRPLTLAVPAGAFDVATDLSGTLHLAYVRPSGGDRSPSGLYYRRSNDGGASWGTATIIQPSRYLRLLPPGEGALRLTADDAGDLKITWQDPRTEQILVIESADGGTTWQGPRLLVASDGIPLEQQALAVPNQPDRLLLPLPGQAGSKMTVCSSEGALALVRWDRERWSATRYLDLELYDPETGLALHLSDPRLAFVPSGDQEGTAGTLAMAGTDSQGDLWITAIVVELLSSLLDSPSGSSTESETAGQDGAVNLSQSGAASGPTLVIGPDNRLHAFWWDQFDGLTVADGAMSASSVPSGTEEVVALHTAWSEPRPVPLSATTTPWILSDAGGRVHALWLQEPELPVAEEVAQPLAYSQLAVDGTAWSSPEVLAEAVLVYDVAADASGALHLAYLLIQPAPGSPVGIYYRRIGQAGLSWDAPTLVYASDYLRLLTPANAHLRLAVDGSGDIYLTFDDPRSERALLTYSDDGGSTWQTPIALGDAEGGAQRGRLFVPQGGEVLVLWETGEVGATCHLVQAPVRSVLDGSAGQGQRVLADLANCPGRERFLPLAQRQVLMITGMGGETLTLALWDGERWSEPAQWGTSFEDVETGRRVYLGTLRVALVQGRAAVTGNGTRDVLVAIGSDGAGDVWATNSEMDDMGVIFAPLSPWSAPASVAQSDGLPGLPAPAADAEGWLHILWSKPALVKETGTTLSYARWDGTQWTRPADVLQAADGKAEEPALVAVGDRLHAVWSGGESGEILYSQAFVRDAYAATGWDDPTPLPAPGKIGSHPAIVGGSDGTLHVVYAVPINEGRGIYYTRSSDGGVSWSPAHQILDAAAAGWVMVDGPQVAVDAQGLLHVAWVRIGQPDGRQMEGVYYAGSFDGGETWSEPFEVAAGAHAWLQIVTTQVGEVHLVWSQNDGQPALWHRRSLDTGQTWIRQERVSGFEGVSAPVALLNDASGALYVVGLGNDAGGEPALLLSSWDGQRWSVPESFPLDMGAVEPGVTASVQPGLEWIQVLFRGGRESGAETTQLGIWHTGRQLPSVAVTTVPAVVPTLTAAPVLTTEPAATARPTASFSTSPPDTSASSLPLPMLAAGVLAGLVVAGGLGGWWLWTRRR